YEAPVPAWQFWQSTVRCEAWLNFAPGSQGSGVGGSTTRGSEPTAPCFRSWHLAQARPPEGASPFAAGREDWNRAAAASEDSRSPSFLTGPSPPPGRGSNRPPGPMGAASAGCPASSNCREYSPASSFFDSSACQPWGTSNPRTTLVPDVPAGALMGWH